MKLFLLSLLCIFALTEAKTYSFAAKYDLVNECTEDEAEKLHSISEEAFEVDQALGNIDENNQHRDLGGCNTWCKFMCQSQGIYCYCCSCCGSRRMLRVTASTERKLKDMVAEAETVAISLLEEADIGCVKKPFGVVFEMG
eukprot:CAMPEP_0119002884 /NCGR_PEP_ID=MMETSP1176-20130426/210_1 /TAXON_ID=265551 /ORGANISM="Synedropsis recta cf, Strain CCMP1620" /LENGTH=140 /DNA_ID=CAMNT_0006954419 /DNA_START=44 /DNA_END=466 /DNA_ORIENTATION=+